ncbi:MAG: hypothetical protein HYY13_13630 [Nitrospirae bacterium]|nr:hypothetical protein [Nitrospirota bacterium]
MNSVSGFECRLDRTSWESCASPQAYDSLADGEHVFEVRALLVEGVSDDAPAIHTWIIDTTLPQVLLSVSPPAVSPDTDAQFEFSCDKPCSTTCALDSGEPLPCVPPWVLSGLSEGTHTANFSPYDSAGAAGENLTYAWRVDTSAPAFVSFDVVADGVSGTVAHDRGSYPSIAFDSGGILHIAYRDDEAADLRYATGDGRDWSLHVLPTSADDGWDISMVFDGTQGHIFHRDKTNKDLRYATLAGGVWSQDTVDSLDDTGYCPQAAVHPGGAIHVAYVRAYSGGKYEARLATRLGLGIWLPESVDSGDPGCDITLGFDALGMPHLVYDSHYDTRLRYASKPVGLWVVTPLSLSPQPPGDPLGIAFDGLANLHLLHHATSGLYHTTRMVVLGEWSTSGVIPPAMSFPERGSLAKGPGGSLHAARGGYGAPGHSGNAVYYYTNTGGGWASTAVDSGDGGSVGLAVDSSGVAHLAYKAEVRGQLVYATNRTGRWVRSVVDGFGIVGEYARVAYTPDGKLHVLYYDRSREWLWDVVRTGLGGWVGDPGSNGFIDNTGDPGRGLSLALDGQGLLHVAYYDAETQRLRYARKDAAGAWQSEVVDTATPVDSSPSIAIGAAGSVYILYRDALSKRLKIAERSLGSTAWLLSDLGDDVEAGPHFALAAVGQGELHAAYQNAPSGDLRYAHRIEGAWTTEVVDAEGTAAWPSIGVVPGGAVHIAYQDTTARDLLHAILGDEGWTVETVDSVGDVGYGAFMRVDADGFVHVTYRDETNAALKYATNRRETWEFLTLLSPTENPGFHSAFAFRADGKLDVVYYDAAVARVVWAELEP